MVSQTTTSKVAWKSNSHIIYVENDRTKKEVLVHLRIEEKENITTEADWRVEIEDDPNQKEEGSSQNYREILDFLLTQERVETEEEVMGEVTNRLQITLDEVFSFERIGFWSERRDQRPQLE